MPIEVEGDSVRVPASGKKNVMDFSELVHMIAPNVIRDTRAVQIGIAIVLAVLMAFVLLPRFFWKTSMMNLSKSKREKKKKKKKKTASQETRSHTEEERDIPKKTTSLREPGAPISDRSILQNQGTLTEKQWKTFYEESELLLKSKETENTLLAVVKVTNNAEDSNLVLGEMLCEIFESMGVDGSFGMERIWKWDDTVRDLVGNSKEKVAEFNKLHRRFGASFASLCDEVSVNTSPEPHGAYQHHDHSH